MLYPKVFPSIICVILTGLFNDCCVYGYTCYYLHEQLYSFHKIICGNGCCKDYGLEEEICCVVETWTTSITVAVAVGCVAVVVILAAICIFICFSIKKKGKEGVEVQHEENNIQDVVIQLNSNPMGSSQSVNSNTLIETQVNNDLPPPYTPGTQPRPTSRSRQVTPIELTVQNGAPPPYTSTNKMTRTPSHVGRLSPQTYSMQPSPRRNLAPSRAWNK